MPRRPWWQFVRTSNVRPPYGVLVPDIRAPGIVTTGVTTMQLRSRRLRYVCERNEKLPFNHAVARLAIHHRNDTVGRSCQAEHGLHRLQNDQDLSPRNSGVRLCENLGDLPGYRRNKTGPGIVVIGVGGHRVRQMEAIRLAIMANHHRLPEMIGEYVEAPSVQYNGQAAVRAPFRGRGDTSIPDPKAPVAADARHLHGMVHVAGREIQYPLNRRIDPPMIAGLPGRIRIIAERSLGGCNMRLVSQYAESSGSEHINGRLALRNQQRIAVACNE